MKIIKLLCVFLLITETTSCQQQVDNKKILDKDFQEYVNLFKETNMPFSSYKKWYSTSSIKQDFVKKYICKQESCWKDWSGYNIEFSSCISFPPKGDFVILIHDESTECGTIRKLSTYNLTGAKISEMVFWADKSFHGHRDKNEVDGYDIRSIIDDDYNIETKLLELYNDEWKENGQNYIYGRFVEYQYKIESNGEIVKVSEKDHGKQKYLGGTYDPNVMPCLKLAE